MTRLVLVLSLAPALAWAQPPPPPPPMQVGELTLSSDPVVDLGPPDFEGVLDDSDLTRDGKPYDTFSFTVEADDQVIVTMTADDFDTYLYVESPSGEEWSNDDFGNTRTSQIEFIASESGDYTITATAFSASGRGAYEIRATASRANVLETISGRLDYQDAQQIKGEYFDELTIDAPASGPFYVELMPLGFSGYMRLTSPGGVHHTTQGSWGERTLRVGPIEGERGTWTVAVTTMSPEEVGAYDVRVFSLEEQ
ncbi:MAG: PPC domain-containing protein [Bacteroidota bacterium]